MRKYLFSTAIIGSLFGAWSNVQITKEGPRDWRLVLMWLSWGISMAIAVGTVIEEAKNKS